MKKSKDARIFTRKKFVQTMLRVPAGDLAIWISAAEREEISRAEFMRRALREKATKTLKKISL